MSLVTLADMKDYLGITDGSQDTYLTSELALFDSAVQNYCNRIFEQNTYIETIYYDDFSDDFSYLLYHYPAVNVTSVIEKAPNSTDESRSFRVNKKVGELVLTDDSGVRTRLFTNYTVGAYLEITYDAGYATVPLEIQEAIKSLIQARYNKKQSGIDLNFGSNVQRINITGVMGIDFDYTLNNNERSNKYGMLLGDYLNIFDSFRSERVLLGESSKVYIA